MAEIVAKASPGKDKKGLFGKDTRPLHRIVGSIILIFILYFGATGSLIQLVDLKAVLSHAAATDPEMLAIRESIDGTPNYSVITAAEYTATALPDNFDFNSALATVLKTTHSSAGDDATLRYIEFRVLNGKPIGIVQSSVGKAMSVLRVDPITGDVLPNPPRQRQRPVPSLHNSFKRWHRLQSFGLADDMAWINGLVGIGLFIMVVTGLVLYFRLLSARSRAGLSGFFWSSGGFWRSLHRGVSIVAAVFLLVVSISGTLLSIDSVSLGVYMNAHQTPPAQGPGNQGGQNQGGGNQGGGNQNPPRVVRQFPAGMVADLSSPLSDAELPAMLQTTLTSFHAAHASAPIKVLRLRNYSGIPQGLLIYGSGDDTHQIVYNTSTGQLTSTTEPSYPFTGFVLGWKWHELMKQIHRGDIIGVPGRLMDLFAGLSMVFLSISGLLMYLSLWNKRRRAGRPALFWK